MLKYKIIDGNIRIVGKRIIYKYILCCKLLKR